MFRPILRQLCGRHLLRGVLRGVGGAVLAGIGWKIGTEIFEAAKKKNKTREAEAETESY